MRLFASLFCYGLVKAHPKAEPHHVIGAEVEKGQDSEWAGFRTLHRLRELADVDLWWDGATLIAKARSRAAGRFIATEPDLWVSIDDDIDAPLETLRALVSVPPDAGIVAAPYVCRDGSGPAFQVVDGSEPEELSEGVWAQSALTFGHGLVAYPRSWVVRMFNSYPELAFRHGSDHCAGLFVEGVHRYEWVGEDIAFCWRAALAGVPMWVLCGVETTHAGRPYTLPRGQVSEALTVQGGEPVDEVAST